MAELEVAAARAALRDSVYDGALFTVFVNCTSGIGLPAMIHALGGGMPLVGLCAAIVLWAQVAQLPGALLVERLRRPKPVALATTLIARLAWLAPLALCLAGAPAAATLSALLAAVAVFALGTNLCNVAWMAWMGRFVPAAIRGRYFGMRSALAMGTGLAATYAVGAWMDHAEAASRPVIAAAPLARPVGAAPDAVPSIPVAAFTPLLALGVAFALLSVWCMQRVPDLPLPAGASASGWERFRAAWRDGGLRRLLVANAGWSLAFHLAAPLFVVWLQQDLALPGTTVALVVGAGAFAELCGLWVWGHGSDRLGARPVIILGAAVNAVVPLAWWACGREHLVALVAVQAVAGFFNAGLALAMNNLLMRSVGVVNPASGYALFAAGSGLIAGLGAALGGWLAKLPAGGHALSGGIPLVFALATAARLLALAPLVLLREEGAHGVRSAVRVLIAPGAWPELIGLRTSTDRRHAHPWWPIWGRTPRPGAPDRPERAA